MSCMLCMAPMGWLIVLAIMQDFIIKGLSRAHSILCADRDACSAYNNT